MSDTTSLENFMRELAEHEDAMATALGPGSRQYFIGLDPASGPDRTVINVVTPLCTSFYTDDIIDCEETSPGHCEPITGTE